MRAYIVIMASLQALVNNLLVWQSSCESPVNSESISPAACRCSAYNQNIDKPWRVNCSGTQIALARETKTSLHFSY